jgi:acyl dehydratase
MSRRGVPARFENILLHEDFGPIEQTIDDYAIKTFAFTMDDYHAWAFGPSPFGRRIGQAGLLANELLQLFTEVYDVQTVVGLHTQEELWFVNPVFEGERVRLHGQYVEKYERRGKGYVVMEADARGEDGRILVRHRGVEILHIQAGTVVGKGTAEPPEKRVTGTYRPDVAPAEHARRGLEPGTPLVPLTKRVMQDQIAVFSRVGRHVRSIHTDLEVAKRAGLKDTLAQGMMEFVHGTELLTRFFGAAWFTSGWQKMKFLRPVYAGESLVIRGAVTGERREADATHVELDVWVENAAKEMTAAGWASAQVD